MQALMKMERHAKAASILGHLVEKRPNIDRFQLDYAATLFVLGRDGEAEWVFQNVRQREHLPAAVRRNVENYLMRIRARQRCRLDLDLGFWHDSNVNNVPEIETVDVDPHGRSLDLQVSRRLSLTRRSSERTGACRSAPA